MIKWPQTMIVYVVCAALIITITGCKQQDLSNVKKHRLIAAENIQLKKKLKQYDQQIERQQKLHNEEMEKQKKLLEKCLQEKKALEELSQEGIEQWMDTVLKDIADENAKLQQENEGLKTRIQELETQIQQLEKELEELKEPEKLQTQPSAEPL